MLMRTEFGRRPMLSDIGVVICTLTPRVLCGCGTEPGEPEYRVEGAL